MQLCYCYVFLYFISVCDLSFSFLLIHYVVTAFVLRKGESIVVQRRQLVLKGQPLFKRQGGPFCKDYKRSTNNKKAPVSDNTKERDFRSFVAGMSIDPAFFSAHTGVVSTGNSSHFDTFYTHRHLQKKKHAQIMKQEYIHIRAYMML